MLIIIILTASVIDAGLGDTSNKMLVRIPTPIIYNYPSAPPANQLLPYVLELMMPDEDCLLPCFWGFHIGQDQIQEVETFVTTTFRQRPYHLLAIDRAESEDQIDSSTEGLDFLASFLPLSVDGDSIHLSFGSVEDLLVRIDVDLFQVTTWSEETIYSLPEVFSVYGIPSQIYLRYTGGITLGYVLVIVYEEAEFTIEYAKNFNDVDDEPLDEMDRLIICPDDTTYDSIEITIVSTEHSVPVRDTLRPPLDNLSVFRPFRNVYFMTGLTVSQFVDIFLMHTSPCIEMLSLHELRGIGYYG
jgi:hypothetical protein